MYRRPFELNRWYKGPSFTWPRANKLLANLEANDKQLGSLVRGTIGIGGWLDNFVPETPRSSADIEILGDAVQWYIRIFEACPRLQQINLSFSTSDDIHCLLNSPSFERPPSSISLTNSYPYSAVPTIRSITFEYPRNCDNPPLAYSDIVEALCNSFIDFLNMLFIDRVNWTIEEDWTTEPLFPLRVKNLKITSHLGDLAIWLDLLSLSRGTLETLSFFGFVAADGTDFSVIPETVGSNLRKLELRSPSDFCKWYLPTYATSLREPRLLPSAFSPLPHLVNLVLQATHGPSLRLLETLAESSPLLRILSFPYSRWVASSNVTSTIPDEIFPEAQILAALRTFQHLRSIEFGILPTVSHFKYAELQVKLEASGIESSYRVCLE